MTDHDELVERVAKAICEAHGNPCHHIGHTQRGALGQALAALAAIPKAVSRSDLINALEDSHLGMPEGTMEYHVLADAILALFPPTSTRTVESVEYPPVPASLAVEFASGADATESWHRYCDEHGLRVTPTPREGCGHVVAWHDE